MVNHGNGIILERLHVCQCLCSHSFTRKVGQTEVVVFQQFHKVGGGAGLEPVAAELQGTEGIQQAAAINNLDQREKDILDKHYIVGKTQMEIANELNISQAQVSRLEKRAIKQLKKVLK